MGQDTYSAVWVSNSSMSDFLNCPRLYYLRNVYKDPLTRHKVNIVNPALALGQTVHEVLEALSVLPAEKRFSTSLLSAYDTAWEKVTGKLGGFNNPEQEEHVKNRGRLMLQRVTEHPGVLMNKAIKIKGDLPHYYLSEEENIILCGKIDWLEYIEKDDSVHIIDFKTGKHDESAASLQLPSYCLLVANCQSKKASRGSYWYLDRDNEPISVKLPTLKESYAMILETAKKVKAARLKGEYSCPKGGCFACTPFEKIIKGQAEFVGVGGYNQDLYILRD